MDPVFQTITPDCSLESSRPQQLHRPPPTPPLQNKTKPQAGNLRVLRELALPLLVSPLPSWAHNHHLDQGPILISYSMFSLPLQSWFITQRRRMMRYRRFFTRYYRDWKTSREYSTTRSFDRQKNSKECSQNDPGLPEALEALKRLKLSSGYQSMSQDFWLFNFLVGAGVCLWEKVH